MYLYDVRGPVVEEAARDGRTRYPRTEAQYRYPAPFGFRTPDEVIYDMSQQLSDCEGYSPSQGLFSATEGNHAVFPDQKTAECHDQ